MQIVALGGIWRPLYATVGRAGSCTTNDSDDMNSTMTANLPNNELSPGAPRSWAASRYSTTRVPVQTLLDYLEAGESIDDFLDGFPSVTREHVIAFLEEAKDRVIEAAS